MKKLVLGIIAILCLQFTFVNYIALQSPIDLAVGPIPSLSAVDNADLSWIDDLENSSILAPGSNAAGPLPPAAVKPRTVRSPDRAAVHRPSGSARKAKPAFTAARRHTAPGEFKNVVIRYDRSLAITDCQKFELPKPKKRSYIAKTITHNPWEVIRSTASNFN